MNGKYIFKSNGEVIAESKNILTTNGRSIINQFLGGQTNDWAGVIALGALYSSATIADTQLNYEVSRAQVTSKSYITTSGSNQLVIKATFPNTLALSVYEIGVLPSGLYGINQLDNYPLSDFSEVYSGTASSAWLVGSSSTTASYVSLSALNISRSGTYNVTIPTGSVGIYYPTALYMSDYTTNDYLQLLYYNPASATGTTSAKFVLTDDLGNTWTTTTTSLSTASGYYSASFLLSASPNANFDYSISTITASVFGTSTASPSFDMLKIMLGAQKISLEQLVSRSSASTAIVSTVYGQPLEIEYYLTVN